MKGIITASVAGVLEKLYSSHSRRQDALCVPWLQILFDPLPKIVPSHCYDKLGTIYIPENSSPLPTRTISCSYQQPSASSAANLSDDPLTPP